MEFKLRLEGDRPTKGDLVLATETPISGVKFIEYVGKCLRRSIDHVSRSRHVTLGALSTYEMNVPQSMAIDSGLFNETNTVTIVVEHDILSNFIFYIASISNVPSHRPCYPYMTDEATLVSYIDELAFLEAWANTGYASRVAMSGGAMVAMEYSCANGGTCNNGGVGCDGCTCGKFPNPGPHHHPHHPPKPPLIGESSADGHHHHPPKKGMIVINPINSTGGCTI